MRSLLIALLLPLAAIAQEPKLAAPPDSISVEAEPGIIAYVDGRWIKVDESAVRSTQGTLRIHQPKRKPSEFAVLVFSASDLTQVGRAEALPKVEGQPLQWRIDVPSKGRWAVMVFDRLSGAPQVFPLVVGDDPGPGPDPDPDPPVDDEPFDSDGFAAMIIREKTPTDPLPIGQQLIFAANSPVASYMQGNATTVTDPKGVSTPFFRVLDDDLTRADVDGAPESVADAYFKVRDSAKSLPWLAISRGTGRGGWQGPLPSTVDETLKLLRKYQ